MAYSENVIFLLLFLSTLNQTNLVYNNDDHGRVYLNCKLHKPGAGVFMLGRGHTRHNSEYADLLLFQYTAHRLLLHKGIIMLLSYAFVNFHLVYDSAVYICCLYANMSLSDKKSL